MRKTTAAPSGSTADWVIDALNKDMPYDEFTVEQIAGDMLPNATIEQKIATGFNRNTMFNEEGGVDRDEEFWLDLVDRVGTTSTVWLGSTLGCAQCHNHKFDPFTQKEFYQFMAFFNSGEKKAVDYGDTSEKWVEPKLDLPTPEQASERSKLQNEIKSVEEKIKNADLAREQADWERGIRKAASTWTTLTAQTMTAKSGTILKLQQDGSILGSGPNPSDEVLTIEGQTRGQQNHGGSAWKSCRTRASRAAVRAGTSTATATSATCKSKERISARPVRITVR